MRILVTLSALVFIGVHGLSAQAPAEFKVIAYYSAGPEKVEGLPAEKLTHIIYSFCHLKGNRLTVSNARDSTTIRKLVSLKKRKPALKVILSLGGWGGCQPCSDVFSSSTGRAGWPNRHERRQALKLVELHREHLLDYRSFTKKSKKELTAAIVSTFKQIRR